MVTGNAKGSEVSQMNEKIAGNNSAHTRAVPEVLDDPAFVPGSRAVKSVQLLPTDGSCVMTCEFKVSRVSDVSVCTRASSDETLTVVEVAPDVNVYARRTHLQIRRDIRQIFNSLERLL